MYKRKTYDYSWSGSSLEVGADDAYTCAPGHDAWVVGDEEFVSFEFDSSTVLHMQKIKILK